MKNKIQQTNVVIYAFSIVWLAQYCMHVLMQQNSEIKMKK